MVAAEMPSHRMRWPAPPADPAGAEVFASLVMYENLSDAAVNRPAFS
jgi:hypothetical protein